MRILSFSFCFSTNTHLYLTGFMFSSVWTTSPNTSCFAYEFSSVWIVSFHFDESYLFRHSSTVCGSWSSSFLMMPMATWNVNILSMIMSLRLFVYPMWLIEISLVLGTGIWSICSFSRATYLSSWVSLSFHICELFKSTQFFICCSFFFLISTESFEPIGLPRFRCVLNSLAMTFSNCSSRTSICVGTFIVDICDFVTFFIFVKTLGNWFASLCKWTIIWTFSSHCLVQGSRWDKEDTYHVISRHSSRIDLHPLNDRKTFS